MTMFGFFGWVRNEMRRAIVGGAFDGLKEIGILDAATSVGDEGAAIRQAIGDSQPDEPAKTKKAK